MQETGGRKDMRDGVSKTVVALLVFLLLPGVSHAAEYQKREALVGLKGMSVVVERIRPRDVHLGLTSAQIKTDVEVRLRKAGVKVLTEKEWLETSGKPFLYVNIDASKNPNNPSTVFFTIRVELTELVTIDRGLRVGAAIWETGIKGVAGIQDIRKIRDCLGDLVDIFINDYLAANPKR
jgi:hypothetical protein